MTARLQENQAVIQVEALRKDGSPFNFLTGAVTIIDPKLEKAELPLKQTGAGQYQGVEGVSEPGVYLIRVGVNNGDQSLGQMMMGLVVPYSPEYRYNGLNQGLLNQLALLTNGGEINPNNLDSIFNPDETLKFTDNAREMWLLLLILVALLFPIDVAVRRLTLGHKDFVQAYVWINTRISLRRSTTTEQPRLLTGLFDARQRARQRSATPTAQDRPIPFENVPARPQKENLPTPEVKTGAQDHTETELDSLARLRQAKKRAKR